MIRLPGFPKRVLPALIEQDADALIAVYGHSAYDEARTRAREARLGSVLDGNRGRPVIGTGCAGRSRGKPLGRSGPIRPRAIFRPEWLYVLLIETTTRPRRRSYLRTAKRPSQAQ